MSTPDDAMTGPHWGFALRVYGTPGVPEACIGLQDRHGLDVNVLLVALYAALEARAEVGPEEVAALEAVAREIREVAVGPLRRVRRAMKGRDFGADTEAVRNRVKAAELAAEQLEQAALADVVSGWGVGNATSSVSATGLARTVLAQYAISPASEDDPIATIAAAAQAAARPRGQA